MWGNILTEVSLQNNFNVNFSNMKSEVLIHLTQWQYWWWFWFSFLWAFYYLIILKIIRFRTLKFRPRLATTFRPHGKWGDLIVCIIPISWCANIITNSNLILRMIEWQAESGLLTIRIRGKQWYWIYKFELKTFTDVLSIPKNIGRNKWKITTPGDLQVSDDYLHILQLRSQNKWIKKYWKDLTEKYEKNKNFHINSLQEQLKYNFYNNKKSSSFFLNKQILKNDFNVNNTCIDIFNNVKKYNTINDSYFTKNNFLFLNKFNNNLFDNFKIDLLNKKSQSFLKYKFNDFLEINRWVKKSQGNNLPSRLIKYPMSNKINDNIKINENIQLFKFRFYNNEGEYKNKPLSNSTFLTMKQKRYKRRKIIPLRVKFFKDSNNNKTKKIRWTSNPYLFDNNYIINDFGSSTKKYSLLRKNKIRYQNTSVVLSKRLLRTRRTLVLPANVNITAITNSYDVIHSWFIPGLGLKMDCIPGRATHHNFYIDNVGFYYGQCAEICGRYHHHMPIRICALPFEHFLLWWHTFGLQKFLYTDSQKRNNFHYGNRKFKW